MTCCSPEQPHPSGDLVQGMGATHYIETKGDRHRVSFKDDPLQAHRTPGGRTLWLNRENSDEARQNFWLAYRSHLQRNGQWVSAMPGRETQAALMFGQYMVAEPEARAVWEISWAATVAAFSYLMEGRTEA